MLFDLFSNQAFSSLFEMLLFLFPKQLYPNLVYHVPLNTLQFLLLAVPYFLSEVNKHCCRWAVWLILDRLILPLLSGSAAFLREGWKRPAVFSLRKEALKYHELSSLHQKYHKIH